MTVNCTPHGKVRVMADRCATCIFRGGNLMNLKPGRVKGMVEDAVRDDSAVICHETYDLSEQAVCRGFHEAHATSPLQIAERLGMIEEVEL